MRLGVKVGSTVCIVLYTDELLEQHYRTNAEFSSDIVLKAAKSFISETLSLF